MTAMRDPVQPPRLATWLLEQFSPVIDNPPLAGDLAEGFKLRHSSGWYWRQVLWVVLIAMRGALRKRWGSFAYAISCGGLISAAWYRMFTNAPHRHLVKQLVDAYSKGYEINWPGSLVYQIVFLATFQLVGAAFAVSPYLIASCQFNVQSLLRTLIILSLALASFDTIEPFLIAVVAPISMWVPIGWAVVSAPTILAMVLAMLIAPQQNSRDVHGKHSAS